MRHRLIEQRPSVGAPAFVALKSVFLHVTKACNLHCAYCYFSARKPVPDEMTTGEMARLWPDLVKLGPSKVIFTGGEPLLRADLFDLLAELRAADPDHRVLRCVNSNGRLVTPQIAQQLVGLADEVRISVDALPAANDALRGEGNFADAMRALEIYRDAGFEPKVLITVTSATLPDLEELLCLLVEKGFARVNINGLRTIGRGKGHDDWVVAHDKLRAVVDRAWARAFPDADARPDTPRAEFQHSCGVGGFLNILPNGDVFPCHALTQPEFRCGTLRTERLLDICAKLGLLGRLAAADFVELAQRDPTLAPLARTGACMGQVYQGAKSAPGWSSILNAASPVAGG